jgi:hypothetical protein
MVTELPLAQIKGLTIERSLPGHELEITHKVGIVEYREVLAQHLSGCTKGQSKEFSKENQAIGLDSNCELPDLKQKCCSLYLAR